MARTEVTVRIDRPIGVVYDCIVRHAWTNDPAWEPEVVGVQPLDAGPPHIGGRVAMTRTDMGPTKTTTYEITALEPDRRLAIRHLDGPMEFSLAFRLAPAAADATDVTVTVDMSPRGMLRLLAPVFALAGPRRNARISNRMVAAIEAATPEHATIDAVASAPVPLR